MRIVFSGRVTGAVRSRPTPNCVQLFEALEKGDRYNPNGLNGFGLVETSTLFVSR